MTKLYRLAKIILLVTLLILATIGVGINAGIPIPNLRKRKDRSEPNTELIEKPSDSKQQKQIKEIR